MQYKAIGLMSGSSLDGLDIVYAHFHETTSRWTYEILESACYAYDEPWMERLKNARSLSAQGYQQLHVDFGHFLGQQVNRFIEEKNLAYQVQFISSHGHTVFHDPARHMTAQLGDGAALAVETGIHVINELRAVDMALGGQGAPIVPIGEKDLLGDYDLFLNLGGIANISAHLPGQNAEKKFVAFDVCPANRVMNLLVQERGLSYDADGLLAAAGKINAELLQGLNDFAYYDQPYPKSLDNAFGVDELYPFIRKADDSLENKLRTMVEHIAFQVSRAVSELKELPGWNSPLRLLATGGGANNTFLVARLKEVLAGQGVELVVPEKTLVEFKEALIMAFIGVLRWREAVNVLASVTGASRDSIGGALWIGR